MYQDNLFRELIVDNFAGGGGASTGIELAVGQPVDIAINHDADAIAMHKVNHPYTLHYQEDIFAIEPEEITGGRPVGVAWFSPDCKHFSRAKGGTPVEKKIRGLSWVILKWAMSKSAPRVIFMENVPEIQTWGPLIEKDGKMYPDTQRKGETFNGFINMLTNGISEEHPALQEACEFLKIEPKSSEYFKLVNGLGYKVKFKELKACDYGAPTIRKRFYMIARNDGLPIVFPEPTYGTKKGLKPYRTAAECIDFSIPCKSIFGRPKDLSENTLRRIARGLDKFVIRNSKPFIMQMNFENAPQDIEEPLSTITAVNKHYLSAPQLSPYIMTNNTGNIPHSVLQPLPTVTGIDHNSLVAVNLSCRYGDGKDGRGKCMDKPMPTITATGHNALIATNLLHYYGGADHSSKSDKPLQTVTTKPRHYLLASNLCVLRKNMHSKPLNEPMPTITTKQHFAKIDTYFVKYDNNANVGNWEEIRYLLNKYAGYTIADDEILIIEINGVQYFIYDVGMRMLKAKELMLAQGFPADYILDIESYIGKKYSEAKQIERMGNAVCPPVATALVQANCRDIALKNAITTMAGLEQVLNRKQKNIKQIKTNEIFDLVGQIAKKYGVEYNEQGIWQPNEKGLGMKHCIDVINSIYGKDFIKY